MSAAWTAAFVLLAVTVAVLAVVVLGLGYRVAEALEGAETLLRGPRSRCNRVHIASCA